MAIKFMFGKHLSHLAAFGCLALSVFLSSCSLLRVYTIDLPQGTPITQAQAQRVNVGMNQDQVLYLLGSPALKDTLSPNRWDYIYDYEAGTDGRRAKKADVHNASQHLVVFFDNNRRVSRIDGISTLPSVRQ